MNRVCYLAIVATLALAGCGGNDERKSADSVAVPAPCLVTATGAALCAEDAIAWCEAISYGEMEGSGDTRHLIQVVPEGAADACAGVGWES